MNRSFHIPFGIQRDTSTYSQNTHTEETGFQQLISRNMRLRFHETNALILIRREENLYAVFQATTVS